MGDDDLIKAEGPILDPVAKDEELRATLKRTEDSLLAPEDAWPRDPPDGEHEDEICIAPRPPDDGESNRFRTYTPSSRPSVASPECMPQSGDCSPLEKEYIEDLDVYDGSLPKASGRTNLWNCEISRNRWNAPCCNSPLGTPNPSTTSI